MALFKKNNWQVLFFYICAMSFYPLLWGRVFTGRLLYWGELIFFTPALIALLCCSLLLFNPKALFNFFSYRAARLPGIAFGFILLISLLQLSICYDGQISYLWSSLYWIAIPLFCAVNRRQVEKYLPFLMIFLGLATILQSFQNMRFSSVLFGIPGNQNWNATLIMLTLPFICRGIYKCSGKLNKISPYLISFSVLIAVVLIFYCKSKATWLTLTVACSAIFILVYWRKISWVFWLRIGVFTLIILVILLEIFGGYLPTFLKDDQRLFLWSGALALIRDNLYFGCGPELFESVYAPYIPADYYFGRLVSIRHTHAHNHLLQFAATMGVPALLAWCSVIVYAVSKNLRQALGQGKWRLKLYLFIFIALLVHSMLDIVVFSWPLGCIFLIVLGILLGRAVENSRRKELKSGRLTALSSRIAGLCCAIVLLNYLYLNLFSSLHYRNARLMSYDKDFKSSFLETEKSIAFKMTPQNTYLAAKISLYDFKNPQACFKFLDMLDSLGFENYEHNNLLRAKALAASGKLAESLLYFAQAQQNFPLSCVNLYYYRLILNKLGRKQQADAIDKHLKHLLKLKGFTEAMLPVLLKDPYIDLAFRIYNENREK